MLITAIEKCKGTQCAVYLDGAPTMMLDAEVIFDAGLRAGLDVDENKLLDLKTQADLRRTRERALHLLDFRSHTKKELLDKLLKTSEPEIAVQIADKMEELGLINDVDYAERYARDLTLQKGYGEQRVLQEMYRKGIDRALAQEAVAAVEVDTHAVLEAIIRRKYTRYLDDEKGIKKTVAALMRLGYRFEDIRFVLRELAAEEPPAENYDFGD